MKKLVAGILGVVLLGIVYFAISHASPPLPPRVEANVVITAPGRYGSPSGTHLVDVFREKDGRLKFTFTGPKGGGGPVKSFDANSGWLMCWDAKDRLWTYVPEQDHEGCRYQYATDTEAGECYGSWDGIPEAFLAGLPEHLRAIYENQLGAKFNEQMRRGLN